MAITNIWSVEGMDAYPQFEGQQTVVTILHWRLTADDGAGHVGSVYGTVGMEFDHAAPFTPYDQLTAEQVVGWAKDALGVDMVAAHEANVARQIADQITPAIISPGLPWAAPQGGQ